jgi:hypothetical protein
MSTEVPHVHLLGSFNRHITVHSQQVRAINLVRALMREPGGLDGKRVAIVGAGFAGLTAAAYALDQTTALISLFEAAPRPLWLQDGCVNRWLHPGIYDWPLAGALDPHTALPVLNWRAGSAASVAAQVRSAWERIAAANDRLTVTYGSRVSAYTQEAGDRVRLRFDGGDDWAGDCVILAIGFGLERGGIGRVGYWNDADGLDTIAADSTVLVTGFGDGGLADLLRLALPDIRQDSIVELARLVGRDIQNDLSDWDRVHQTDGVELDRLYAGLKVAKVIDRIKDAAPAQAKVTLAGRGHLFGPRSAILNRFLISQLRQARGTGAFSQINAELDEHSIEPLAGGRWRVRFRGSPDAREFDYIVLRVGPEPAFRRVAPLAAWPVGEERRNHWYAMPQALDQTRFPFWELAASEGVAEERHQELLAYESSSRRWCLVVHPAGSTIKWPVRARLALEKCKDSRLNIVPLVLSADEAIVDREAFRRTVRALCTADIVIADITAHDPAVMLLLGVRAAVRRSVTIACTQDENLWETIPFNLRELGPVLFRPGTTAESLVAILRAGLQQADSSSGYLDLPVYDFVRGSPPSDDAAADRVLLLRAFAAYTEERKDFVEGRVAAGLTAPGQKEPKVESVIDQRSPRLASQRLYEAIRHHETCVADLTYWRANVLFELGVRMTVRDGRTFCILDRDEPVPGGSHERLQELLTPFMYSQDVSDAAFREGLGRQLWSDTYEVAASRFETRQDNYAEHVDAMLFRSATATPGHDDPLQAVDLTPLYARTNQPFGDEVRHSVFERLCAAWFYLADREDLQATKPVDVLDPRRADALRRFRRLSSRLKAALTQRRSEDDKRLRARIDQAENLLRLSGAQRLADLLDSWTVLRRSPPWLEAVSAISDDDRDDVIEDVELHCSEMRELAERLDALSSPVCDLPLQGVRSNLARLEIYLQELKRTR